MTGINIGGAAAVGLTTLPYVVLESTGDWYFNVWRVLNGTPTRLSNFTATGAADPGEEPVLDSPRLSNDGNWVAVDVNWQDESPFAAALYVVPGTGGDHIEVWNDGGDQDYLLHPSWHPDNDQIVFSYGPQIPSIDFGYGGSVYRVQRTDPGVTPTLIWEPDIQYPPTQREFAFRPEYSPDGSQIAFLVNVTSSTGGGVYARQGLWVMNADGTGDTQLDSFSAVAANRGYMFRNTQLAWSNDGDWIAYVLDGSGGGDGNVYKIQPDGSNKTLIRTGAGNGFENRLGHGAWVPDDSEILISASDSGDSGWRIFSTLTDGSETETEVVPASDGPKGFVDFEDCFRNPLTNRIEWIRSQYEVYVSAIDGSGMQLAHDIGSISSGGFVGGTGFEFV